MLADPLCCYEPFCQSMKATSLGRGLRSSYLAIILLLAIAALAAVGTIVAQTGPEAPSGSSLLPYSWARVVGLRGTYSSPLFLLLVALLAINVAACSWHRLSRRTKGAGLRGASDLLMHASLLLLLAGGTFKVIFGFVGTQNIHVGTAAGTAYDWRTGRDVPLGFQVVIGEFQEIFYPVRAKIGVRRVSTKEKVALLDVVQGAQSAYREGGLVVKIVGYDPDRGSLRVEVQAQDSSEELALATSAGAEPVKAGGYELSLVAYRADLKQIQAHISVLESGALVKREWLGANDTIRHQGTNLFLTAWGTDDNGKRYCGIQFVRDPGGGVFWAGCVLLALAVPLHLFAKGRRTRVTG